ncbi:MAG: hypothetical protein NVSMB52_10450 [Chloroflexota bacterium]
MRLCTSPAPTAVLFSILGMLAPTSGIVQARTGKLGGASHQSASKSIPQRCKSRVQAHGTIKYSDWQFPDTLNPYQSNTAVSTETIDAIQPGASLFLFNRRARLIPYVASTVPTTKNRGIQNGGRTFIVHLRKGLLWHNGTEVTSRDVQFGWKVDMDQLTGPLCSGTCDVISRIDTPNRYTVVYHLKHVYSPFLTNAIPDVWPTIWTGAWKNDSHKAATKLGQDSRFNFESANFPTTGPYEVTNFVQDNRIVLHPNRMYDIANCGAAAQSLIFVFYASKAGMIAAASAHSTDITQDYTPYDISQLAHHTSRYKVITDPGFYFEHLELNHDPKYHGKPNPLSDTRVRQALALALDKAGLIQSALRFSRPQVRNVIAWSYLVISPTLVQPFADRRLTGQWDSIAGKYTANTGQGTALQDARTLMSQTPFKDGFGLDFYTISGNPDRAAEEGVIAKSWQQLGVTLRAVYVPSSKLLGDWDKEGILAHGNFQVGMFAYLGGPDPDGYKLNMQGRFVDREQTIHANINSNYSGIHDGIIDRDYTKAAQSLDPNVRQHYYSSIQVQVNKNAHWIPLYYRPVIATTDRKVSPFSVNPTTTGAEWNTFQWRRAMGS